MNKHVLLKSLDDGTSVFTSDERISAFKGTIKHGMNAQQRN